MITAIAFTTLRRKSRTQIRYGAIKTERRKNNIGEFLGKCQMPNQQTAMMDGIKRPLGLRFLLGCCYTNFSLCFIHPPTLTRCPRMHQVRTDLVCWFSVIIVQLHFQFVKMCNLISFDNYVSLSRCPACAEGASLGNWASAKICMWPWGISYGGVCWPEGETRDGITSSHTFWKRFEFRRFSEVQLSVFFGLKSFMLMIGSGRAFNSHGDLRRRLALLAGGKRNRGQWKTTKNQYAMWSQQRSSVRIENDICTRWNDRKLSKNFRRISPEEMDDLPRSRRVLVVEAVLALEKVLWNRGRERWFKIPTQV